MRLPGGLWDGGQRRREFAFRPISGEIELAVAEQAGSPRPLPNRITAVLAATLEQVGGAAPDPERIHWLPVGDRQFLMRALAGALGRDTLWLAPQCQACHERFDLQIQQTRLPVKEAGPTFPHAVAATSGGHCRLRVPTGADQEATASIGDDREAARRLARRCMVDHSDGAAEDLNDEDLARIERALEEAAPEVATVAESACPACGHVNRVYLDPYAGFTAGADGLWDEIHELATAYHWGEREILGLPRARRRRYLRRIAQSRGMAHAAAAADAPDAWW